jgi:CDP-diacylglycerol pyrophosphatase
MGIGLKQTGLAIAILGVVLGGIAKLLIGNRDPEALWKIAHGRCVADLKQRRSDWWWSSI